MLNYVMDGILLCETITGPFLKLYDAIILDEVHKRTLSTDIIFNMTKVASSTVRDSNWCHERHSRCVF